MMLKKNSSLTVNEIAKSLNLNRNTVSKIIKFLNENYIKNYTISLKEDENSSYIIAETENIDSIDKNSIVEYYKLSNGKYLVIINRNFPENGIKYSRIDFAIGRYINFDSMDIDLYCDYCNNFIAGEPVVIKEKNRDYYFCCHTCEHAYLSRQNAEKN